MTGTSARRTTVRAAGTLLWRPSPAGDGHPELALVHRPLRQDWSLPKGKLETGEHVTAAAVREVAEETGYHVTLGRPLPTLRYEVDGLPKQVRYWAARADDAARDPWSPGPEVDAVDWLAWDDARERLTYPRDGDVLTAFADGPPDTVPTVVVRHAKAVKRAVWEGTIDAARPLEPRGVAQARRLVPLLDAYGITAVLTSDATRCRDTVLPYARARRLEVVEDHDLSEEGHRDDPGAAAKRATDLLADPRATVVSSHRPLLPELLAALLGDAARSVRRVTARPLPPAGVIVLHRDLSGPQPLVVAAERYRM